MSTPVDPTSTAAWAKLAELKDQLVPDLRGWFAADPERAERFSFTAGDLFVDLSKNLLDDEVLATLLQLADEAGVAARRDAMFSGEKINVTEDRAVLHTALRDPSGVEVDVDGTNVPANRSSSSRWRPAGRRARWATSSLGDARRFGFGHNP